MGSKSKMPLFANQPNGPARPGLSRRQRRAKRAIAKASRRANRRAR